MSYLPIKIKSTSASILTCREGAKPLLGINIKLSHGGKTPLNLSRGGKTPLRHQYFYKYQYPPCIFLLKK